MAHGGHIILVHEHGGHGAEDPQNEPGAGDLAEQRDGPEHREDNRQRVCKILLDVVSILDHHAHNEPAEHLQAHHAPHQRVEALVEAALPYGPAPHAGGVSWERLPGRCRYLELTLLEVAEQAVLPVAEVWRAKAGIIGQGGTCRSVWIGGYREAPGCRRDSKEDRDTSCPCTSGRSVALQVAVPEAKAEHDAEKWRDRRAPMQDATCVQGTC